MNEILRAGGDGEGVFWTLFIIIWIIGKASAASRKARQKAPAASRRTPVQQQPPLKPKLPPAELQAFLDSLTGARPLQKPAAPPRTRQQQIASKPRAEVPVASSEIREAEQSQTAYAGAPKPQVSLLSASVRDLITNIPSVRMPNLSMGFSTALSKGIPHEKPNLRDKSQLRKAMLGHLILGPPGGLAS